MILPPRLGLNDLMYIHRAFLLASSSDTDHAVALLANRKLGSYWAPTAAAFIAGAQTVSVYPVNGQRLAVNWTMQNWANGDTVAPVGWTLAGTDGTIAKGTTAPKIGSYNAEVTRVGTDVRLYQADPDPVELRGRQVTGGMWVTCGTGDRAYVSIYDGTTRWTSTAHTGGGTAEWLSISSGRIAAAATSVVLEGWVKTGNVVATFEGALLTLGGTAASTPHATSCDYIGLAGHTCGTDGTTVSVSSSTDNFSTSTTRISFVPTTLAGTDGDTLDRDVMRFFTAANAPYWRVTFTGGQYSPPPQVQILALGLSRAMPRSVVIGFDPNDTTATSETSRTAKGAPLGRLRRQAMRRMRLAQTYLTEDELSDMRDIRQHAVMDLQPFFMAWDPGDHREDAAFVWAPDNVRWSGPLERLAGGLGTRGWALDLEAVAL